jgi:hypothetical protein
MLFRLNFQGGREEEGRKIQIEMTSILFLNLSQDEFDTVSVCVCTTLIRFFLLLMFLFLGAFFLLSNITLLCVVFTIFLLGLLVKIYDDCPSLDLDSKFSSRPVGFVDKNKKIKKKNTTASTEEEEQEHNSKKEKI